MPQSLLWAVFVIGCGAAFIGCLIAYWQELREKVQPESPVVITGVMFLLALLGAATLNAALYQDPCTGLAPWSWGWLAGHCYW